MAQSLLDTQLHILPQIIYPAKPFASPFHPILTSFDPQFAIIERTLIPAVECLNLRDSSMQRQGIIERRQRRGLLEDLMRGDELRGYTQALLWSGVEIVQMCEKETKEGEVR